MKATESAKLRRWAGWLWLPVLIALGLGALMFRGGGALYWGPADSDLVNQFYPWHVFIHRWLMRGVLPWWDPHVFSGYPTLETQQMLALNPVHLISLLLPAQWGLPAQMALHTLIAAAGMAWALWRWGRVCPAAAAVGACVWAFGGLFGVRVAAGHFTVVAAIAWWPVALLGVMRIARSGWRGASRWLIFWTILAHTMTVLAGGPQYVVYLFYMDVAVALAVMRRRGALRLGLSGAGVWVLAVLMAAPQWLPAFWYLPYSSRASGGGGGMGRFNPASLWNIWLEAVMPYPFGDDLTSGHLHFKNVWETATYPGTLAWILTLGVGVSALRWVMRRMLKKPRPVNQAGVTPLGLAGLALVLVGLYMAVGGWLPGFSGFREPTKARAVCAMGFALASSAGLNALLRKPIGFSRYIWLGIILHGIALAAVYRFTDPSTLRELLKTFGPPFDPAVSADYNAMLQNPAAAAARYSVAFWTALGLVGLTGLFLGIYRRFPAIALVILTGIGCLDPAAVHYRNWQARHLWEKVGVPAALKDFYEPRIAEMHSGGNLPWRVVLPAEVINRTHHLDGFYEYRGYDPLMPAGAVGRLLVDGLRDLRGDEQVAGRVKAQRAAGIRFETVSMGAETTGPKTKELGNTSLFDFTRNVTVGNLPEGMSGPSLEGVSFVEEPLQIPLDEPTTSDTLIGCEYGPNRWSVTVEAASAGLLLWKSTWLPGWNAQVDDGPWQKALKVNGWMCGIEVPAGKHEIAFIYRPIGLWISLLMAIVASGVFVLLIKKKN